MLCHWPSIWGSRFRFVRRASPLAGRATVSASRINGGAARIPTARGRACPATECHRLGQGDRVYDREATETCAAWLLAFTLGYMKPSQYADASWGISTFRQRVMERCRRFVALSRRTGFLPALRTWVEARDAVLRAHWLPDTEEMRFYESFLQPVKPDPLATEDLFKAVENGSVDDLSRLLEANPSLANARAQDDHGTPALQRALEKNRPEMVRLLAQAGADLTTLTDKGRTAWAPAIQRCDPATVQFLVDQGLDANKRDFSGQLPIHVAIDSQRPEMVALLKAAGARIDFLAAVRLCDLETATSLLAAEPERAPAASIRGETLLHQIAALGDGAVPFAALLLEHGADVNGRSGNRRTPLQIALEGGHERMIALLKEHGAEDRRQKTEGRITSQILSPGLPKKGRRTLSGFMEPEIISALRRFPASSYYWEQFR